MDKSFAHSAKNGIGNTLLAIGKDTGYLCHELDQGKVEYEEGPLSILHDYHELCMRTTMLYKTRPFPVKEVPTPPFYPYQTTSYSCCVDD